MPPSFLSLFFYEYPSVDEFWLYVFLPEFYYSGFMGGIRCRNKNDSEIITMITQQSWPSCKFLKHSSNLKDRSCKSLKHSSTLRERGCQFLKYSSNWSDRGCQSMKHSSNQHRNFERHCGNIRIQFPRHVF